MNVDDLLENIKKFMIDNNKVFFSYAWRENVNNLLISEDRYSKLIDWINKEIEIQKNNMNIFNPADKVIGYTNEFFKNYETACKNIAMLLNFKEVLLDSKCTIKMRENIEYTICKLFNIKYNEMLNDYVG